MTTVTPLYDAEVEYLESTERGPHIDTGVIGRSRIKIVADLDIKNFSDMFSSGVFGFCDAWKSKSRALIYFKTYPEWTTNGTYAIGIRQGRHEYICSDKEFTVVGVGTRSFGSASFSTTAHVGIFGILKSDGTNFLAKTAMKCYSFKIYTGNDYNLVWDGMPVRFTNELGVSEGAMYDKVSGQLFRNQGTGAFKYGPDVRMYSTPVMGLHLMRDIGGGMTAKDYIQDGLIAMWDGIENAGWGVHDPAAAMWKDLSGNGLDLTVDATCGEWGDDRIIPYPNNGCPAYRLNAANEIAGVTGTSRLFVEVVTRGPVANNSSYYCVVCLTYFNRKYNQVGTKNATIGQYGCAWSAPIVNQMRTFSLGMATGYINGELITTEASTNIGVGSWGKIGSAISIAGLVPNTAGAARGYPYPYPIHAIRVYRGDLSPETVAANYAIDKERFNLP